MMAPSRLLRRLLGGEADSRPFERLNSVFARAQQSVWIFYLLSAVNMFAMQPLLHADAESAVALDPVWPVFWLNGNLVTWADSFSFAGVAFALLASWKPQWLLSRVGFAVALLLNGGLNASFGGINHVFHAWFWMAVVFTFLPSGESRPAKLSYCLTFASAQALLLMFYTMAGIWKVGYGLLSLWAGIEGNLSPRGLSLTLADRILQTGTEPLFGHYLALNWQLAWPAFVVLMYIQLFAIVALFRPRLHVAWGLGLLAFHIGTWLLMEIANAQHFLCILAILILSPFRYDNWMEWRTLRELPLIGRIFRISVAQHQQAGLVLAQ